MHNKSWVSFDCWGTILKANPQYRDLRNKLLRSIVFPEMSDVSDTDFAHMVKAAKDFSDYSNEGLRSQMSSYQSMLLIGYNLKSKIDKKDLIERFNQYDVAHLELFMDVTPEIYSEETSVVLYALKKMAIGMNISCNTSFINGDLLDMAFKKLDLNKYFNFTVYSDRIGRSKPSINFYKTLITRVGVDKKLILHVGDNDFSDGGSVDAGIDFLYINADSNNTISKTLNYIK